MSNKNNKNNETNEPAERGWRTTDEEWARLRERVTASELAGGAPTRLVSRLRWIAAAAAALVIGVGVSWRLRHVPPRVATIPAERLATTGVGERLTIRFADSSVVIVGPVSTIRYSESVTGRSVALVDGIAEFSVVHDTMRPFQVRAKNTVVTDVGTEFGVRAYAADSGVRVSVASGIVAVSGGASDSVELRAGQAAFVAANGSVATITGASAQTLAAWVHDRLVFDNAPLSTVAAELSRWFDVQIRIPNQEVAQRRVSAMYNRATLSGVLDAIAVTLPVRYERSGNTVTILPAKP